MPEDPLTSQEKIKREETVKQIYNYVVAELNKGIDKVIVSKKLVESGMETVEADKFVETVKQHMLETVEKEKIITSGYLPALSGGIIAALLGGLGWGWLAKLTNKEYGYVMLCIGFLCGSGVLLFTKGKKGTFLQIIASICCLFGILTGKYFIFLFQVKDLFFQKFSRGTSRTMNLFSAKIFRIFIQKMPSSLNGFDALWIILAVLVSWGMLAPSVKKAIKS